MILERNNRFCWRCAECKLYLTVNAGGSCWAKKKHSAVLYCCLHRQLASSLNKQYVRQMLYSTIKETKYSFA